ncbi:hypothetical protein Rumeso_04439 [Rubellimicrobium mesophilum DSM 19309]|uniref:ATPase dynein-related AAA domain-containing protein n=2 Tax=Rubellimicrobium TaxID=295418 RepID=A0A017HIX5_9RHOB|nr:hypothetical protein Rumeso_04439 [Rubellimicrobium mesophilum DSM 19309]
MPFLLCLDEMNLARVEHYLADFLSLLEDRRAPPAIRLQAEDGQRDAVADQRLFLALEAEARRLAGLPDNATLADILLDRGANDALHRLTGLAGADTVLTQHARLRRALSSAAAVPPSLPFPTNLRLVGTINVDDTTHALSPKILDRAHVLRVPNPVLADWAGLDAEAATWVADGGPDGVEPLRLTASDLGERGEYPPLDRDNADVARLLALARDRLEPLGVEFGLRAVRQGAHYLRQAAVAGIGPLAAMNNVALHKVLPKLTLDLEGANGPARRAGLRALRDDFAEMLDDSTPPRCLRTRLPRSTA